MQLDRAGLVARRCWQLLLEPHRAGPRRRRLGSAKRTAGHRLRRGDVGPPDADGPRAACVSLTSFLVSGTERSLPRALAWIRLPTMAAHNAHGSRAQPMTRTTPTGQRA